MNKDISKWLGLELRSIKLSDDQSYNFHTGIFLGLVFFFLLFVVIILSSNGFDYSKHLYLACNSDSFCDNALYHNYPYCVEPNVCDLEVLPPHFSFGSPPPFYISHMNDFIYYGLLLAFIINHLIFNKGFSFRKLFKHNNNMFGDKK